MNKDLKIKIAIDNQTKEIKSIRNDFDKLDESINKGSKSTALFQERMKLMAHAGAAIYGLKTMYDALSSSVGDFIRISDNMTNVTNRLNLVTNSTKELKTVQEELFKISQNSRVAYGDTADLYSQMARSTQELNLSQRELLNVTDTISKTLIISGGSADSMNAALTQLGQGFASGTLRGEELNSIMEQTPRLAQAIAQGMGISIGELRAYGQEGKLTAKEVIDALKGQAKTVKDEFDTMGVTVDQAYTNISNSSNMLIKDLDNTFMITSNLSESMQSLSSYLDTNRDDIIDFAITSGAYLGKFADGFNLVYETLENTAHGLVNSLNITVYGALKPVMYLLEKSAEGLNILGFSSDESLKKMNALADFVNKGHKNAKDNLVSNMDEVREAYKDANISIEDRITLQKAQIELDKKTSQLEKKRKDKEQKDKSSKTNKVSLQKEQEKLQELEEKHYKYRLQLEQELLENKKQYQEAWMIEREKLELELFENDIDLTSKLAQEKIAIAKDEYFSKFLKENKKTQEDAVDDIETTWDRVSKNMYESFDDYFFSKFKDGISNLTDELGIFGDVLDPILRDVSSSLANSFTPNLQSLIGGSSSSSSIKTVDIDKLSSQGFIQGDDGFWSKDSANGGTIKVNSSGIVTAGANLLSDKSANGIGLGDALNLTTLPSSISNIGNLISNPGSITSGISSFIADPMTAISNKYVASIMSPTSSIASLFPAGGAANVGINSFGAGMSSPFTAAGANFGGNSMAYAGGQALVGGAIGYGVGSIGDKIFGADTHAATAGAIGGAIGTAIFPGIGTAIGAGLGSIIGGIFGKSKTSVEGSGLKVLDVISEENSSFLKEYTDYVKKKKSWFSSSTRRWTTLTNVDKKTLKAVSNSFKTLNNLGDILLDVTSTNLSVGPGKYKGSSLITSVLPNLLIDEVSLYGSKSKEWKKYAKEINKTVIEALSQSTYEFQDALRNMSIFSQRDDTVEQLKLQAKYAKEDYEALGEATGISLARITVDNFNERYRDAIRRDFTPETIENWSNLGDALMAATTAQEQYKEALEQEQKRKEQELKQQRLESLQTLNAQKANALELKALQDRYNQEQKTYLQNAINQVRGLSNDFERFMDTIENTIYDLQGKNSSNQSQNYLISKFWDKKTSLDSLLEKDGDLNKQEAAKMQDLIRELTTISTNIQSSFGDNNTLITNSLVNELQGIDLELNKDNEILKTQIVDAGGNDVGVSTEGTLTSLTNAIERYNDSISEKLKVDEELKFEEFKAGGLLSTEDEIRFRQSFEALSAETYKQELADLRTSLSYLSLETTDKPKYLEELYDADINAFENVIEFFKSIDNFSGSGISHFKENIEEIDTSIARIEDKSKNEAAERIYEQVKDGGTHIEQNLFKYLYENGVNDVSKVESIFENFNSKNIIGSLSDEIEAEINSTIGSPLTGKKRRFKLSQSFDGMAYNSELLKEHYGTGNPSSLLDDLIKEKTKGLVNKDILFSLYHAYSRGYQSDSIKGDSIEEIKDILSGNDFIFKSNESKTLKELEEKREYYNKFLDYLPSYDTGTSYVPNDQTANIHKGEMIIDPRSSSVLRDYGIKVQTNSNNFDNNKLDELIKYLKNIQNLTQQNGNEIKKLRKITEYGVV